MSYHWKISKCNDCDKEVVHFCYEDKPLLLKAPISPPNFKLISKVKSRIMIKKLVSIIQFRKCKFTVPPFKIYKHKYKPSVPFQNICNKMRVIKMRKSGKLFISINKSKMNRNFPKSKYLRTLLNSDNKIRKCSKKMGVKIKMLKHKFKLNKHIQTVLKNSSCPCNICEKNSVRLKICKHMSTCNLKYLRKIRNKIKRASNGNIKNMIKIMGWNKGSFALD